MHVPLALPPTASTPYRTTRGCPPTHTQMLGWTDLRHSNKGGGGGGGGLAAGAGSGGCPDLSLQLKVGKVVLRSHAYQEEVVTQVWGGVCWPSEQGFRVQG